MNYIVITVILTAVCAAWLFAQEAEEISKELEGEKSYPKRPATEALAIHGAVAAPAMLAAEVPPAFAAETISPSAPDAAWDAPASGIHVTGTSRMGTKTVAIINGKFSGLGDLVEVRHNGQMYQWKVRRIQPDGKVNLERYAVKTVTAGIQQEK